MLSSKSYADIYADIRSAIDFCHRDGSLKRHVAANPGHYIHKDQNLVPLLQDLRFSGKKTFIVTNSFWDYTNIVMNYLIHDKVGAAKDLTWLDLFEVVVTGSAKPKFFQESQSIFQVDTASGCLLNTDEGNPMVDLDADSMENESSVMPAGKVFQGGNYHILNRMLGIHDVSGSSILYVGDHIYGDILKSKKTLGWRTMLVVPEMDHEIAVLNQSMGLAEELFRMRKRRDAVEDEVQRIQWKLAQVREGLAGGNAPLPEDEDEWRDQVKRLEREYAELRKGHSAKLSDFHAQFHAIWGQLLKTGYQNSRFSSQIERFACLYTSHVGNLRYYSPNKSYRGLQDEMPHDMAIN